MESSGNESSGPNSPQTQQRWWKLFKHRGDRAPAGSGSGSTTRGGVFSVPLQESLACASVAISQVAPDNKARIYGHIPVVVAKTGLYLKENGTSVEGVFRKPGSEKRVRELEQAFDSPPLYGKDLVWDNTYSVHDAATVLKRFLNSLPQPVVPFELYSAFQDALPRPADRSRNQTETDSAVNAYKGLIDSLPAPSQHLLFYLLDVLGVFARKSDINLMTAANLATTFQPGLLRHPIDMHGPPLPSHLTALVTGAAPPPPPAAAQTAASADAAATPAQASQDPAMESRIQAEQQEYKKSIEVIEFLITHQASFELQLPKNVQSPSKVQAAPALAASISAQSHHSLSSHTATQTASPKMTGSQTLQLVSSRESDTAHHPLNRSSSPLSASQRPLSSASPQPKLGESKDRNKVSLGRRNSDRGAPSSPEARRLRRKKQPQQAEAGPHAAADTPHEPLGASSGVRRAKTLPSGSLSPAARKQQAAAS